MELDCRSYTILQIVVESYIYTAQPVSSASVSQQGSQQGPELELSSATIRAIMADLEAAGLLTQPHTSAGRIPTERGLRVYLDTLVSPKLRPWDRTRLEATAVQADASDFPTQLGQVLSGLSGQLTVVAVPGFLSTRWREVGLVRCDAGRFLVYFVSVHGVVQQTLVEVNFDATSTELMRIQNYLNACLAHHTLNELRAVIRRDLQAAQASCELWQRKAFEISQQSFPDAQLEVLIEGTSQLLNQPEFTDLDRLKALVCTLAEKEALLRLLDRILEQPGVCVMLGSDHPLQQLPDLACVGCTWQSDAGAKTAIGLLGPRRMDYSRLMPLVKYATELFGRFCEPMS